MSAIVPSRFASITSSIARKTTAAAASERISGTSGTPTFVGSPPGTPPAALTASSTSGWSAGLKPSSTTSASCTRSSSLS